MVYYDNASTTKMLDCVVEEVNKYFKDNYFNPSTLYKGGIDCLKNINMARDFIAQAIGVSKDKLFFTSGGTESANFGIRVAARKKNIKRLVVSSCEHSCVYNTAKDFSDKIFCEIKCNIDGTTNIDELENVLSDGICSLVMVMHVNNETGAINDVDRIAKLVKKYNKDNLYYCDGVQAFMKEEINLKDIDIDFYGISSHKINGPKGIGALYIKNPLSCGAFLTGGGQEKNLRSGTENVPAIMGFYAAAKYWISNRQQILSNLAGIKEIFVNELSKVGEIAFNTNLKKSSPHILNISISGLKGEVLLHMLEGNGIYVGVGSACSSHSKLSRALKAMNIVSEGTLRFSFGIFNSVEEANNALPVIVNDINTLREIMR